MFEVSPYAESNEGHEPSGGNTWIDNCAACKKYSAVCCGDSTELYCENCCIHPSQFVNEQPKLTLQAAKERTDKVVCFMNFNEGDQLVRCNAVDPKSKYTWTRYYGLPERIMETELWHNPIIETVAATHEFGVERSVEKLHPYDRAAVSRMRAPKAVQS